MKIRHFLALTLPTLALAGYLYERRAERRFHARAKPQGTLIEAQGRALYLRCMGERRPGQPTVIFEAGHGAWSSAWQKVMPAIARRARVCAADRAGYGWSTGGPLPITPEQIVADLREMLQKSGETSPYLFVGHSMGASISRLYASLYPDEVTGMVWVDSAHEDMLRFLPVTARAVELVKSGSRFGALLARLGLLRLTGLNRLIAGYPSVSQPEDQAILLEQCAAPLYLETLAHELDTLCTPAGWRRTKPGFQGLPVTMLEAQYPNMPPIPRMAAFWQRYRAGWFAMQDDLAARVPGVRRVKLQCAHNIMNEQPEAVIAAVEAMLDELEN